MRHFLFSSLVLCTIIVHAQPGVKTISGVMGYNVDDIVYFNQASASANTVALRSGDRFAIFDFQKGTITRVEKKMDMVSSDHRYTFRNTWFEARRTESGQYRIASEIQSAGIFSDTAVRRLAIDYHIVDMDEKGRLVATKIWYDSVNYKITGMKGLYKLDRSTGKILQTLRDDTLSVCKAWNGCWTPVLYLQKNFAVIRPFNDDLYILPYGETRKIAVPVRPFHTLRVDSLVLFTISDSTLAYRDARAFDTRTGELIARKRYDRPVQGGQAFESYRNKLYRLQWDVGMIFEETPGQDGFTVTKTWDIRPTMNLAIEQVWTFAVLKGPTFFVAPLKFDKGQAIGEAANTAHLFQTQSNKMSMQVYPFYHRSADETAASKANDKWLAQRAAEQDSIAHPERYCHKFWNTEKYRRGLTIFWGSGYHIMAEYDCKADKYKLWRPGQSYEGNGHYLQPQYVMVSGEGFREKDFSTNKHYETCSKCEGDGRYEYTEYTTKTKELPWGYFSGIETKRISTTATTTVRMCQQCGGNGVVLK